MATEKFANSPTPSTPSTAWATITAGINSSVTALALSTLSPFPATVQFRILIDDELMLVTALPGGLAATVTRGVEGTTAAAHSSGASVYHVLSAAALARSPRSMTTLGDIEYLDANGAPARLGIGSVGQVLTVAGGLPSWASPISLGTQTANTIFAGPTSGGAATATFRALVAADIVSASPAATTQLLFNNAGTISGSADLTWTGSILRNTKIMALGNSTSGFDDAFRILRVHQTETVLAGATLNAIWSDNYYTPATSSDNGSIGVINVDANVTGANDTTGSAYGIASNVWHAGTGSMGGLYAIASGAHVTSTGTVAYVEGYGTSISLAAGSTVTDGVYTFSVDGLTLNGNVPDYYGFYTPTPTHASGMLGNYYSFFISDHGAVGASGDNYVFYYGGGKFTIDGDGKVDALAYKVGGVAGVSFGPAPVASITVVNGIVTAIS